MFLRLVVFFFCFSLLGCYYFPAKSSPPEIKPESPTKNIPQGTNPSPKKKEEKSPKEPDSEMKDLHYVRYRKGYLEWELWASNAYFRGKDFFLKNLRLFLGSRQKLQVQAKQGFYDSSKESFFLKGQVVLTVPNYGVLKTSSLIYSLKKHTLFSKDKVEIENQGLSMEGIGFIYKLDTGELKILEKSRVLFHG